MTNARNLNGKMWWTKFSFKDYEADIHLRMCSLAAQGLWMRMLCIMNAGAPHGYLSVGEEPITEEQLSRLAGCSVDEVTTLIKELENKQIFSRDEKGIIYNRRMVRDHEISKIRAKAGRAGGRRKRSEDVKDQPAGSAEASGVADDFAKQNAKQNDNQNESTKSKNLEVRKECISKTTSLSAEKPPKVVDLRDQVWTTGKRVVSELTGKPDREAGAVVGKLVRDLNQDLAGALAVITEAERIKPLDLMPWLQKAVAARKAGAGRASVKASVLDSLSNGLDFDQKTHKDGENTIAGQAEVIFENAQNP